MQSDYRAAREQCAFFDLSDHGQVELAGPGARLFLHNLCTNDVKDLPVGGGCEAFLTNAKARVVGHVWIGHYSKGDESVLRLDMVAGQSEKLMQHLNRYLISEPVELADRTGELAFVRLCGPQAGSLLRELTGSDFAALGMLANVQIDWQPVGPCHVRRQALLGVDGYDVFCAAEQRALLSQQLCERGAVPASRQTYETLRVEAGLPSYGPDIDENRFVVEVNRPHAISYTKGCYLGQEPIVMARDRGQVNRLLLGVTADRMETLPMDAKLFQGETEVGLLKSSAHSPSRGKASALAYLRRGNQEPGTILEVEPRGSGARVTVEASFI